jgi:hypothetical protein
MINQLYVQCSFRNANVHMINESNELSILKRPLVVNLKLKKAPILASFTDASIPPWYFLLPRDHHYPPHHLRHAIPPSDIPKMKES